MVEKETDSRESSLARTITSITYEFARNPPPFQELRPVGRLPSTPVRPSVRLLMEPQCFSSLCPTVNFMPNPQHSSTWINPNPIRRSGNQTLQEYTANLPSRLNRLNAGTMNQRPSSLTVTKN